MEGKTESINDTTQGDQLLLDLAFAKRAKRRFIPVDVRNAFGISGKWASGQ